MYLGGAYIESNHIAKGQKTRTAKLRFDSIMNLQKGLGAYPSDSVIKALFTNNGIEDEDIVAVIQADIKAFQESELHSKAEFKRLMDETNQLLKEFKEQYKG